MERQLSSLISGLRLATCASGAPLVMLGWLWCNSPSDQGEATTTVDLWLLAGLMLVAIGFIQCARGPVSAMTRVLLLGALSLLVSGYLTSAGTAVVAVLAGFGIYAGALCRICDDVLDGRFKADIVSAVSGVGAAVVAALVSILLIRLSWIFWVLGSVVALLKLLAAVVRYFRACWCILGALQRLRQEQEPEFLVVTRRR